MSLLLDGSPSDVFDITLAWGTYLEGVLGTYKWEGTFLANGENLIGVCNLLSPLIKCLSSSSSKVSFY